MREWWSRIRFFVTGKKRAEVDEEIQFHWSARSRPTWLLGCRRRKQDGSAAIAFGGRERAREECREERPSCLSGVAGARCALWSAGAVAQSRIYRGGGADAGAGDRGECDDLQPDRPGADAGAAGGASRRAGGVEFCRDARRALHSEGGDTPGHMHEFSYPMYSDLRDGTRC